MEQRLMQELGLEVEDIIHVPALFETVAGCEGRVSALIPNLVNVLVASLDGQHTHVFLPDPFVRAVEHDQDSDPLIQLMRRLLPSELSLHFVDNWYPHHLTLGGMHCATNTQRAPQGEWWNQAQPVSNVP